MRARAAALLLEPRARLLRARDHRTVASDACETDDIRRFDRLRRDDRDDRGDRVGVDLRSIGRDQADLIRFR